MQKLLNKKYILIFSIITFIALLLSLFYKPPMPLPVVLDSKPTSGSIKVNYFDQIFFKLDQIIDPSLIKAVSIPEENWSINSDGPSLILKSEKYLRVATDYTLTLLYQDKDIYTLKFKTLSQQSDPRYAQEVGVQMKRDYPLAAKLPFENSNYYIIYLSPLTIEIKIKNSDLSAGEALEEVKSWITQNGGDVVAHKFTIATP